MAGADARDPHVVCSRSAGVRGPLDRDSTGTRVAWCPDLGGLPLDRRVSTVLEAQRQTFEELGCIVEDACPDFGDVDEIFLTLRTWASWNTYGSAGATSRADEARSDLGHRSRARI